MSRKRRLLRASGAGLAIATFCVSMSAAADISYVRAGKLIDVEKAAVLSDQLIRVVDGRVDSISAFSETPGDGPLTDWSSFTVLPGLGDMHSHLVGDIQGGIIDPLLSTGSEDVLAGVANGKKTVCAGFTFVRDVGSWRAFTDVALRDAINKGYVEGPRMAAISLFLAVEARLRVSLTTQRFPMT